MSLESRLRILLVCTGNTCRSPLAAAALGRELEADRERVEIGSAGTAAMDGSPASAESAAIAARDGLDLEAHRARQLTPELARGADLLIVMERSHRAAVERLGIAASRVRVISEWPEPGEPGMPVSDPYGGSSEAYEECWRRIQHHVKRIVPHVREALRARSA